MTRAALLAAAALALAGAATGAAQQMSHTQAAAPKRCASPPEPSSTLKVARGPGVRVQGVDCATGRRVARAYVVECRDELLYEADCVLVVNERSWRCGIRVTGAFGDYSRISCRAKIGREVRFDVFFQYT